MLKKAVTARYSRGAIKLRNQCPWFRERRQLRIISPDIATATLLRTRPGSAYRMNGTSYEETWLATMSTGERGQSRTALRVFAFVRNRTSCMAIPSRKTARSAWTTGFQGQLGYRCSSRAAVGD